MQLSDGGRRAPSSGVRQTWPSGEKRGHAVSDKARRSPLPLTGHS